MCECVNVVGFVLQCVCVFMFSVGTVALDPFASHTVTNGIDSIG